MAFPRTWILYASGAFLTFNLFCWIAEFTKNKDFLKSKLYLVVPFAAYFFLHLTYSIFQESGWLNIEKRLMFFLLPIIGIPVFRSDLILRRLAILIKAFVAGLFSVSMILLIRAALVGLEIINKPLIPVNSIDAAYSSYFSSFLSFFQHQAYFSLELNFAIILLILFKEVIKLHNLIRIPLFLFFVIFIYLLSSRAGIIACAVSLTFLFYVRLKELRPGKKFHLLFPAIIALAFISIILINPRISSTSIDIKDKLFSSNFPDLKDLEPRTRVWYTSIQLIREYPVFGVGEREVNQKLVQEYRRNNFYAEAFFTLNAHNQFLETQLTYGIPGTILLIWMLFAPLIRKRSMLSITLYYSFLIIIIVHFSFESMLVRQWGIIFFVLFTCLQVFVKKQAEDSEMNKVSV